VRTNNTFLFFLCFVSQFVLGQNIDEIEIHGIITADSSAIEGVNVVNLTTDQSTSSNDKGDFYLFVKEGDLLAFSAVNLVNLLRGVTRTEVLKNSIVVEMQANSIPLKEVVVTVDSQINAKNLGIVPFDQKRYTPAERKLYTARSGLLDRTAMLKKEVLVENKQRLMNRLEYLFGDRYYVETLKIPQDYISGFQYYCIEDENFVSALNAKNKTLSMFLIIPLAEKYNKIIAYEK
jgi:hypothetical protein